MKKYFILLLLALMASGSAMAQKKKNNPFVGVWQKVTAVGEGSLTLGNLGKVFLPDGRVFGYFLDPLDFENYEKFEFAPWMFADYKITSDSTYTENVYLHSDASWEGTINFEYRVLNSRTLLAIFEHTYPDGTQQTVIDLWIKVIYDEKELKKVLKKVSDNWEDYIKTEKKTYGRE